MSEGLYLHNIYNIHSLPVSRGGWTSFNYVSLAIAVIQAVNISI